jgi:hypothetical protein
MRRVSGSVANAMAAPARAEASASSAHAAAAAFDARSIAVTVSPWTAVAGFRTLIQVNRLAKRAKTFTKVDGISIASNAATRYG